MSHDGYSPADTPQKAKPYCAQTGQPLSPGADAYRLVFSRGIITQELDFRPLGEGQTRLFSSDRAVHDYTSPRDYIQFKRRVP